MMVNVYIVFIIFEGRVFAFIFIYRVSLERTFIMEKFSTDPNVVDIFSNSVTIRH